MEVVLWPFCLDGVHWNIMKTSFPSQCLLLGKLPPGRAVRKCLGDFSDVHFAWVCHPYRRTNIKKYWLCFKVIHYIQALYDLGLSICNTSKDHYSEVYTKILLLRPYSQPNWNVKDPAKIYSSSLYLPGDFSNDYDDNNT